MLNVKCQYYVSVKCVEILGSIWTYLDLFGPKWTHLDPFGHIWMDLV